MKMMVKSGGKASSVPIGLLWGGVTSLSVTLSMSALLSWLVLSQRLEQNKIGYGVMVLLVLASFLGAKVSFRKIKCKRLAVSCMAGCVYFAILLSVTALFFGGQYEGVGETALMVICGCGLAVLLHWKPKSGKRRNVNR